MLDREYRARAQVFVYKAGLRGMGHRERLVFYKSAIDNYSSIKEKTLSDHRAIASAFRHIAITQFNWAGSYDGDSRPHYEQAGEYYLKGIQQYREMPSLEDEDFREITELYIDLSDVCCHLLKHADADEALRNAILAFKQITIKTPEELAIGDPAANLQGLYQYIEKITSHQGYLSSTRFKNYQKILMTRYEDRQMADLLGGVSMAESVVDPSALDSIMSGLDLSNRGMPMFAAINLDKPSNDLDYRSVSIEYLRLTQQHMQQGNINLTLTAYRQALSALKAIRSQTAHDQATIKTIETQIDCIEAQEAMEDMHIGQSGGAAEASPAARSLTASIGLFGHQAAPSTEHSLADVRLGSSFGSGRMQ